MIQDNTLTFAALAPVATQQYSGSVGMDLNPNFGAGHSARKAPLFGQSGEDLLLRFEVFTDFVVSGGNPVIQLHAVVSTTGAAPQTVIQGANVNFVVIGTNAAPQNAVSSRYHTGYIASELVAGNHWFVRFNPWTSVMGRSSTPAALNGQDLRYLGILLQMPNFDVAGTGFSAGIMTANLVKAGDIMQDPADFIYPAGTVEVG